MTLREEYKKYNHSKNADMNETILMWLKENVILINEEINDKEIQIFNARLAALDNLVNQYGNKIPELKRLLEKAETDVSDYLAGSIKEKYAHIYLLRLTYLSNIISKFFSKRIKNLIGSHIFSAAKKFSDVKLNVLSEPGYNPEVIKNIFANNLNSIIKEANIVLKKFEKNEMPKINVDLIAAELLNLSYNELQELIGLEPIKMMTTDKQVNQTEQPQEIVAEELESLNEVDTNLINKVKQYNKAISLLKKAPSLEKMPNLKTTVDDLDKKINKVLTSKTSSMVNTIQSIWGGDMDSQIMKLTQYLKSFTEVWNLLKEKYDLDPNDNQNVLSFYQDKTVQPLVNKMLNDKKLAKDFLSQTPNDLENFSNSLKDYFNQLQGVPTANKTQGAEETTQQQTSEPAAQNQKTAEPAQATQQQQQASEPTAQTEYNTETLADEVAAQIGLKASQIQGVKNLFDKMNQKGFKVTKG